MQWTWVFSVYWGSLISISLLKNVAAYKAVCHSQALITCATCTGQLAKATQTMADFLFQCSQGSFIADFFFISPQKLSYSISNDAVNILRSKNSSITGIFHRHALKGPSKFWHLTLSEQSSYSDTSLQCLVNSSTGWLLWVKTLLCDAWKCNPEYAVSMTQYTMSCLASRIKIFFEETIAFGKSYAFPTVEKKSFPVGPSQ